MKKLFALLVLPAFLLAGCNVTDNGDAMMEEDGEAMMEDSGDTMMEGEAMEDGDTMMEEDAQ